MTEHAHVNSVISSKLFQFDSVRDVTISVLNVLTLTHVLIVYLDSVLLPMDNVNVLEETT